MLPIRRDYIVVDGGNYARRAQDLVCSGVTL